MMRYEVLVWVDKAATHDPAIVTAVEMESAAEAMVKVLRSVGLPGAVQVEVRAADGLLCWRWRLVVLLSGRRFLYCKRAS